MVKLQPETEIRFGWRSREINEAIFAVVRAVSHGYNTRETLLAALPYFSNQRIALAIDALISADMAEINLGVISTHTDMDVVLELVSPGRVFVLPLSVEDVKAPGVRRALINKLGCTNPAGVESLLNWRVVSVGHEDL